MVNTSSFNIKFLVVPRAVICYFWVALGITKSSMVRISSKWWGHVFLFSFAPGMQPPTTLPPSYRGASLQERFSRLLPCRHVGTQQEQVLFLRILPLQTMFNCSLHFPCYFLNSMIWIHEKHIFCFPGLLTTLFPILPIYMHVCSFTCCLKIHIMHLMK